MVGALFVATTLAAPGCFGPVDGGSVERGLVSARPPSTRWHTVVNGNDPMPNSTTGRTFNSFNQPSVNADGVVVFRARSRGGPPEGPPTRGIFVRDRDTGAIRTIVGGESLVPAPNNLASTFIEFPSIPRIGIHSDAVATRGNHPPVWEYDTGAGDVTRAGTTGVYVALEALDLASDPFTAASKLGGVPTFDFYAVPGVASTIPFDVFPGSPAITDASHVAFKGNYTDGVARTGVFYRELLAAPSGGSAAVQLIANSDTVIPNLADCASYVQTTFGSTAPPSAATDEHGDDHVVFVGLDLEEAPECGGIYRAPLSPEPPLTTLIAIGDPVPDEPGAVFARLGEGLSYEGRFVGFWGAWGTATRTIRLYCPEEGNRSRIDYCNHALTDPQTGEIIGDPNSVCDDATDATDTCYQEQQVPVNQGIFVHDVDTGRTYRVARTVADFDDFVYWVYSGRVPGTGEGEGGDEGDDGEPARWRSSAFVAVSRRGAAAFVAFKARTGALDPNEHTWIDPVDGIYLGLRPGASSITRLVDTLTPARVLDDEAPPDALVTEVGLERDGFRGRWLVISARMGEEGGEEEEGLAGIYLSPVP